MDPFDQALFDNLTTIESPEGTISLGYSVDDSDGIPSSSQVQGTVASWDFYFDSHRAKAEVNDSVRRQKRKEQNRAAQRAYRERKVNHTVELEGRINYLEVHIEELKVENKQLEVDISNTKTKNGALRKSLLGKWHSHDDRSPSSPQSKPRTTERSHSQPVLLKDLLTVYSPHKGDDLG